MGRSRCHAAATLAGARFGNQACARGRDDIAWHRSAATAGHCAREARDAHTGRSADTRRSADATRTTATFTCLTWGTTGTCCGHARCRNASRPGNAVRGSRAHASATDAVGTAATGSDHAADRTGGPTARASASEQWSNRIGTQTCRICVGAGASCTRATFFVRSASSSQPERARSCRSPDDAGNPGAT